VEETKPATGKGHVEVDGKKYFFVYNGDNAGELKLYDEFMQESLLTCSFNTITNGFTKTKSLLDGKFASLLLVLCWYGFSIAKCPGERSFLLQLIFFTQQCKTKRAAHIYFTTHMNGLAVCFNNVFANGKTKAAATNFAASGRVGPVKPFKYAV